MFNRTTLVILCVALAGGLGLLVAQKYFAAPGTAAAILLTVAGQIFDGRVALGQAGWQARLSNRYDLEARRASNAGLGLMFRNECLLVDLSLSRRFTSSTSVRPTTDLSVSVELLGFGGSTAPGPSRQCRG